MTPIVLEQYGRTAPGAQAISNRIVHHRLQLLVRQGSGKKKEPKPKLLSPDIFWWVGGLPREGVGAKKFGMSLETRDQTTLAGHPGILLGYPGGERNI